MKYFYALLFNLLCSFTMLAQTSITMPSGTTITSASGSPSQWARNGGDQYTVSKSSWSSYGTCLYYGWPNTLTGVIDGHNTNNCASGLQNLTYNSGLSNLAGGILVFTGNTNYYWVFSGNYNASVRLTITVTTTGGSALALTNNGSISFLKISQNFVVKYQLEATNPNVAGYMGAINSYDYNNNSDGSSKICTSIRHDDKFYQVVTTATASNAGPYCSSQTMAASATGAAAASGYVWTQTGSGASFSNTANISFTASGAANKRMKVEVTGTLGCKDSAITIIQVLDTAVEINVKGNNQSIPSGTVITSLGNFTNLGNTNIGTPISKVFKIFNTANQALKVSNITGSGVFTISGISFPKIINGKDSTTFSVVFTPTASGVSTGTISITNIDCDEGVYTFTVKGAVTQVEMDVFGNGIGIADGDITPSLADSTIFGATDTNSSIVRRYKIKNTASDTLVLSGVPKVQITGTNAAEFTLIGSVAGKIPGGDSLYFYIKFSPKGIGTRNATINIVNNDANENPYNFDLEGSGLVACDSFYPAATSIGLHNSSSKYVTPGGWTCFCDSVGKLLLSLKLGGTGAVIPANKVSLKITTTGATFYPNSFGFVGNGIGWVGIDRTWDVAPTTQPSSKVPVRFYFKTADITAINAELTAKGLATILGPDSMTFYKVINGSKPAHSVVTQLTQSDVKIYKKGAFVTDSTWIKGSWANGYFAEFAVNSFSGGGGGAGPSGISPLITNKFNLRIFSSDNKSISVAFNNPNDAPNQTYQIYKGKNQNDFKLIGEIASTGAKNYFFRDLDVHQNVGYYYYVKNIANNTAIDQSNIGYGIVASSSSNALVVYPNPSSKSLYIVAPMSEDLEKLQWQLYDFTGKLLKSGLMENGFAKVDLQSIIPGMYAIKVVSNGKILTSKIEVR